MSSNEANPRFLRLTDVAEILNTSVAQVQALVRSGDLRAIKIGGRGQWRVETVELEKYIQRQYDATRALLQRPQNVGVADDDPLEP